MEEGNCEAVRGKVNTHSKMARALGICQELVTTTNLRSRAGSVCTVRRKYAYKMNTISIRNTANDKCI